MSVCIQKFKQHQQHEQRDFDGEQAVQTAEYQHARDAYPEVAELDRSVEKELAKIDYELEAWLGELAAS